MTDPHRIDAARIERLQRRRTRLLFTQGIIFLLWQTSFFTTPVRTTEALRTVDHVRVGAYVIWAALLVLFLSTGGGYILPRAVREVLNDESTIEHRRRAMTAGFLVAMAAAVGCYLIEQFEAITAGEAVHVILSLGVATALLRFAMLERRAQRDA
jgi:hypothetical protein